MKKYFLLLVCLIFISFSVLAYSCDDSNSVTTNNLPCEVVTPIAMSCNDSAIISFIAVPAINLTVPMELKDNVLKTYNFTFNYTSVGQYYITLCNNASATLTIATPTTGTGTSDTYVVLGSFAPANITQQYNITLYSMKVDIPTNVIINETTLFRISTYDINNNPTDIFGLEFVVLSNSTYSLANFTRYDTGKYYNTLVVKDDRLFKANITASQNIKFISNVITLAPENPTMFKVVINALRTTFLPIFSKLWIIIKKYFLYIMVSILLFAVIEIFLRIRKKRDRKI